MSSNDKPDPVLGRGDVLAIIPCRGGSKRLPGKNRRDFMGKPLFWWTLDAARKAPSVTRVIVSTDDDEIIRLCPNNVVPFKRPAHLATDEATSEDVVIHALDWLRDEEGYGPETVVLLQATSPLRTAVDVEMAIRQSRTSCVSVSPDGERNGAIYVKNVELYRAWCESSPEFRRNSSPWSYAGIGTWWKYQMPWERSIDIDTAEDFALAEWVAKETWR